MQKYFSIFNRVNLNKYFINRLILCVTLHCKYKVCNKKYFRKCYFLSTFSITLQKLNIAVEDGNGALREDPGRDLRVTQQK